MRPNRSTFRLALAASLALAAPSFAASTPVTPPFWAARPGPAEFTQMQEQRLERAKAAIAKLKAAKGPRTIENTLVPLDEAQIELNAAGAQANLVENTHPDSALRAAAEQVSRTVSAYGTQLALDRELYDALVALDVSKADPATKFLVEKALRDFRLGGVDKDAATREKITAIRKELVETSQAFSRNIRAGVRTIQAKPEELKGLPQDYIARHKPGADGLVTLTTEYPDAGPVFDYAENEDLRKRMHLAYGTRAYPENMPVLDSLIAKRHRLANLLGYPNWAEYMTADRMVGSAKNASEFIDKIVAMSKPVGAREYQTLLAEKRKDDPKADAVHLWENAYYSERVRKANYGFDAQSVRPYFPYKAVRQGVLDVTAKLFGVEFRPAKDAPVFHPSIEAFELVENGEVKGRFYLDMHPRKNKYTHAAHFGIRTGVAGKQIPEATLVCNFPGGDPDDPGLMQHGDVETFFHEFGHLVHNLFASQQKWVAIGGIRAERDFAEAPSQLLEEWMADHAVLATFGKHYQTGEVIPATLVQQMKRANDYGKGLANLRQMTFARLSLSIYDRDPAQVNTDAMAKEFLEQYQPYKLVEGTHFQTAFGHLDGYSAGYYTYMWSLVIAKDLFSAFDPKNLMDPAPAKRYREKVLAPGGSKPAATLVSDFLGRPFDMKAYEKWLAEEVEPAPAAATPAAAAGGK
jgi:thimet oligopeptidase